MLETVPAEPPPTPARRRPSRSRWWIVAAVAALLLATAGTIAAVRGSSGDDEVADRSRAVATTGEFVDSVGVNVHMSYSDTPYGDVEGIRRSLGRLGIRHLRDGLEADRPDQHDAFRALGADGRRLTLIMGRADAGESLPRLLDVARELRPGLAALEGPNESDAAGGEEWPGLLREYQAELRTGRSERTELDALPIVGPSLIGHSGHGQLGDVSELVDFGNVHSYPGGDPPEWDLDQQLSLAATNTGNRPVQATETGYHTALSDRGGHPPVSERAAGVYLPRLYLEYFRRGIARTFAYELVDEFEDPGRADAEANFGLLRRDLSPKPAFTALANLLALMRPRESGGGSPEAPAVSLEGNLDGVRQLTLRREDGTNLLALWRDVSVWDRGAQEDVDPPTAEVTVKLDRPVALMEVFRPSRSSQPERSVRDADSAEVALGGDVAVVALTP